MRVLPPSNRPQKEDYRTSGNRFRLLRGMAQLTRKALADVAGCNPRSILYWEQNTAEEATIGAKSLRLLIEAFRNQGIECSGEWLLTGTGSPPRLVSTLVPVVSVEKKSDERMTAVTDASREEEIQHFLVHHPSAVTLTVKDLTMAPFLLVGDIVGGIWQPSSTVQTDHIGIVEIHQQLHVRLIKVTAIPTVFDLQVVTYHPLSEAPLVMKGMSLSRIAPLVRLWR